MRCLTKKLTITAIFTLVFISFTLHPSPFTLTNVYAASKGNPPIAHWRFDEGGGTTAYDDSANNYDGTLNAGTVGTNTTVGQMWTRQGKIGSALECDSNDDRVSVPTISSLPSITITGWFKYNTAPATRYLSIITDWWNTWGKIYINPSGQIAWQFLESNGTTWHTLNSSVVSAGAWHYFAVTFDKPTTTARLYLDGVQVDTETAANVERSDNSNIRIGHDQATLSGNSEGLCFDGLIDDMSIYNYARTADQILVDYNAGSAAHLGAGTDPNEGNPPIGYWKFDENTGTTLYDRSGNGRNGAINGATWVVGKYGSALNFNNSSSWVDLDSSASSIPSGATNLTVEAWVKWNNIPTANDVVVAYGGNGTDTGWILHYENTSKLMFSGWGAGSAVSNVTPVSGRWYYIVATYDHSYVRFYLDGELKAQTAATGNITTSSTFRFGNEYNRSYYLDGVIDEVKIYNYARTQAQIAYDYNKGKPLAHYKFDEGGGAIAKNEYSTADTGAAPVGWWRMDNSWTDASGNGSNGTASGGATFSSSGKIGPYGGSFDGIDDYVNIGDVSIADFNSNSDFTLEAWINPSAASTGTIISNENSNESGYNLIFTKDRNIAFVVGGAVSDGLVLQLDAANTSSYSGTGDYWYDLSGGSHTGTLGGGDNGFIGKPVWNSDGYFTFSGTDNCIELSPFSTIRTAIVGFYPTATSDVNIQYYQNGRRLFDYGDGWPSFVLDNYSIAVANYAGGQTPITWTDESGVVSSDTFSLNTPNIAVGSITTRTNDGTGNYQSTFSVQLNNGTVSTAANKGIASDFGISRIGNGSRSSHTPANTASYHTNFEGRMYFVTAYNKILSSDERTQIFLSKAYRLGIANNATTTDTIPLNSYTQVVAKKEGATCSIYINGILSKSFTCNLSQSLTGALRIGARTSGVSEYFNGKIDDARIYNYARTAEQIYNDYKTTHGTLVGDTKFVDGKIGKALQFDGTGDYAIVPHDPVFNSDYFTVSAWYKSAITDVTGWQKVVGKGPDATEAFALWINPTGDTGGVNAHISGTNRGLYGTSDVADQAWHFVASTYDGTALKVYIDGKLENSVSYSGVITANSENVSIGIEKSSTTENYSVNGNLDDVKFYNYARTTDQVIQDYNAGMSSHAGVSTGVADPWGGALPVGYWKLDENTGVLAKDASGNGNDGAFVNSPTWTHGKIGPCLNFNGSSGHVSIGNPATLNQNFTSLTLEAWIYANSSSIGSDSAIAGKFTVYGFTLHTGTPNLYFYINNGGNGLAPNYSSYLDAWHHIAGTFDGTTQKIYIDGKLIASRTSTSASTGTGGNFGIGGDGAGTTLFNGKIDDVKIYNYARTPAQIAWDYNKGKPVGYWRFDEAVSGAVSTSAGAIKDESDNNYDGTASNTTWTYATGKFGGALSFDGNDYVESPSINIGTGPVTFSLWAKGGSRAANQEIGLITAYQSGKPWFFTLERSSWGSGGVMMYVGYPDQTPNSIGGGLWAPSDTNWHYIAMTRDSSSIKLYFDGKEVANSTHANFINFDVGNKPIRIGHPSQFYWDNLIDDVRVYNYARTADQILQDYNQGLAAKMGE